MTITVGVIGATGTAGGMVVEGLLSSLTAFVSQLVREMNSQIASTDRLHMRSYLSHEKPPSIVLPTADWRRRAFK